MSPAPRARARSQRASVVSVLVVVFACLGSFLATLLAGWHPLLGLDLDGGLSVVYQAPPHTSTANLDESATILTNRVDALGVSGAKVEVQGDNVVVSIPGVKNPNQVLSAIGQTAQLYFRPVLCYAPLYRAPKGPPPPPPASPPTCGAAYQLTQANLAVNPSTGQSRNIPPDPSLATYPTTPASHDAQHATVVLPGLHGTPYRYVLGPAPLTGRAVKSALAQQNQVGAWVVNYTLTSSGSSRWDDLARQNFHQLVAIELDGVVQSAPIIQPDQSSFTSFEGQGQISGGSNFTETYAKNLALAMQYGALPVRLTAQTTQTVSPTLGRSSLEAGLVAGLAGLGLVMLYVIVYYRALGLVVLSGLALTAALLWALVSALGHSNGLTLDLAGVTGLIVSVGITVDSYIVYFERLKDETRAGRTLRTSVDRGFQSAWRTVLAADLVSLIGAVLLYFITVGAVKGFAFFLGLSTLLDLVITYFYTRPLVLLLGRSERLSEARLLGIARGVAVPSGASP
ncbi:MAG TPA: protein translocase subunit SecD [Acidimicrobiales bacterium]|nr:protein translocase subunit SecD [Acidimicrobiales bacterium]